MKKNILTISLITVAIAGFAAAAEALYQKGFEDGLDAVQNFDDDDFEFDEGEELFED